MNLQFSELENGIRMIKFVGALDLTGSYGIEVEFVRQCQGHNIRVLVDLSEVDYISSIGVHMLVNAASSIARRGGKIALLNPQRDVMNVLELIGIPQIIPIHSDLETAKAGLLAT
jgi:anti-sigma B factor antagonist/stage II sporulation protein AA (anti-sigma F factor antagonist)